MSFKTRMEDPVRHANHRFRSRVGVWLCCCQDLFRFRDRDLDKMNSSALESRDHGLEITTLAATIPIGDTALVLKLLQITCYRRRHQACCLETKTETLPFRYRDRDQDLDKMNSRELESRDHGLEIATLGTPRSAKLCIL